MEFVPKVSPNLNLVLRVVVISAAVGIFGAHLSAQDVDYSEGGYGPGTSVTDRPGT